MDLKKRRNKAVLCLIDAKSLQASSADLAANKLNKRLLQNNHAPLRCGPVGCGTELFMAHPSSLIFNNTNQELATDRGEPARGTLSV